MNKRIFFCTSIRVGQRDYTARGHISPMILPPHASYDHPRKFYARPATIDGQLLLTDDDGNLAHLHGALLMAAESAYLSEWVIDQTAERMIAKAVV